MGKHESCIDSRYLKKYTCRSFGEHLQELFPFIDSLSRRSSVNNEIEDEEEGSSSSERKEEGRRRRESKRMRKVRFNNIVR